MDTQHKPSKNTEKSLAQSGSLKTEGPLSEKDEVKAAEERIAKQIKKTSGDKGRK